jgi:Domain of unknown function (DUF1707)
MKCGGIHCEGCGHDRGAAGGLAAAVLLVIIVGAAVRDRHAITSAIEIAGYVLMAIAAVTASAGIGYGVWRARRHALETRDRRISPQVRAVITDVRAGRPIGAGWLAPGHLEPPRRLAAAWELTRALYPERDLAHSLIGDADRERLIAVLREHYAAGRLGLDELCRRTAVVLTASYSDEAADALFELPPLYRGAAGGER